MSASEEADSRTASVGQKRQRNESSEEFGEVINISDSSSSEQSRKRPKLNAEELLESKVGTVDISDNGLADRDLKAFPEDASTNHNTATPTENTSVPPPNAPTGPANTSTAPSNAPSGPASLRPSPPTGPASNLRSRLSPATTRSESINLSNEDKKALRRDQLNREKFGDKWLQACKQAHATQSRLPLSVPQSLKLVSTGLPTVNEQFKLDEVRNEDGTQMRFEDFSFERFIKSLAEQNQKLMPVLKDQPGIWVYMHSRYLPIYYEHIPSNEKQVKRDKATKQRAKQIIDQIMAKKPDPPKKSNSPPQPEPPKESKKQKRARLAAEREAEAALQENTSLKKELATLKAKENETLRKELAALREAVLKTTSKDDVTPKENAALKKEISALQKASFKGEAAPSINLPHVESALKEVSILQEAASDALVTNTDSMMLDGAYDEAKVQGSSHGSTQVPIQDPSLKSVPKVLDWSAEMDLQKKYFPAYNGNIFVPRCLCCGESDHTTPTCPEVVCTHCESSQHFFHACVLHRRCEKCGERGHVRLDCTAKLGLAPGENLPCDLCGSPDHHESICHMIWRTYKVPAVVKKVNDIAINCYSCGSSYHFGDECGLRRDISTADGNTWSLANRNIYIDEQSDVRAISAGKDFRIQKNFSIKGKAKEDPIDIDSDEGEFLRPSVNRQSDRGNIRVNPSLPARPNPVSNWASSFNRQPEAYHDPNYRPNDGGRYGRERSFSPPPRYSGNDDYAYRPAGQYRPAPQAPYQGGRGGSAPRGGGGKFRGQKNRTGGGGGGRGGPNKDYVPPGGRKGGSNGRGRGRGK